MDNSEKIILHLCASEYGSDTRDYREAGYDVRLITKDIGVENYHPPANVYGIIANPPCTKFSKAGWQIKKADRDFKEGMRLVKECLRVIWEVQENGAPLKFWFIENPMGYLYNFLGKPTFYYQPWQFGDMGYLATKREALWGYFNEPVKTVHERSVAYISLMRPGKNKARIRHTLFGTTNDWKKENKDWYKASSDQRSIASPYFTKAFFLANP